MTVVQAPEFSVVVPTWNRKDLLARALRSLMAQTHDDFEVLVVDDGSTDGTEARTGELDDPRIRFLSQEHGGVSKARNRGVVEARGRYVTFLDSDDEATAGWLEDMAAALAGDRTAAVCGGVRMLYRAKTEILLPRNLGPVYCGFAGLFLAGSYALRTDVFRSLQGFVEGLAFAENTEFGLRLTAWCRNDNREIASIARDVVIYHRDRPARPLTEEDVRKRYHAATYIVAEHGQRYRGVNHHALGNYCAIAGVNAARMGLRSEAVTWLLRAIKTDPWRGIHYGRLVLLLAGGWSAYRGVRRQSEHRPLDDTIPE